MEYLKSVFGLFVGNIANIAIITLVIQAPLLLLNFVKLPSLVIGLVGIVAQVLYVVSVIKLIDYRSKGDNINWLEAIKRVRENWIMSAGAIIFQSFMFSLLGRIPLLPILVTVILAVSIPIGAIGGRPMIQGAIESFSLVKSSMLDVLLKLLVLSLIMSILLAGLEVFAAMSPVLLVICRLIGSILATLQVISSLVLFYNLSTAK